MRMLRSIVSIVLTAYLLAVAGTAQPGPVDVDTLGPQVGQEAPAFSGIDQFGGQQTLTSLAGAEGLMLVFYRSADW
jgi:hypothetical protein